MAARALVVLREHRLGATLFALPAIRAAARHLEPGTELWVLHGSPPQGIACALPVLSAGAPIAGFLPIPEARDVSGTLRLVARLRRLRFSHAVHVGSSCQPVRWLRRARVLLRLGGIRTLLGFRRLPVTLRRDPLLDNQIRHPGEALRRLLNLRADGVGIAPDSDLAPPLLRLPGHVRLEARTWLDARRRRPELPLAVVCPGAASRSNLWPVERFVQLGQLFLRHGSHELLVCGGPNESAAARRLIAAWGQGIDATGRFPVLGTAALLEQSQIVIGLDTGTTHLAAAVGAHAVCVQGGRMPPGVWDPLGAGHVVVRAPVQCVGCTLTECAVAEHPCMRGIAVEAVWQAAQKVVSAKVCG